jgi:short-subunit dehydrogenase
VTISSILAPLAPSHLSDYAASKTAASTLHASLQHEIASHTDPHVRRNLKTLLVEVGQLDTGLFGGDAAPKLPAWARFFGPVVEAKDVVRWITWYLERGEGGVVRLPFYARCVGVWWGVVPSSLQRVVRWASGVDGAVRLRR